MIKKIFFLTVIYFLDIKVASAQDNQTLIPVSDSCPQVATEVENSFLSNDDLVIASALSDRYKFIQSSNSILNKILLQEQYNYLNPQVSINTLNTFQNIILENNTTEEKKATAGFSIPSLWWAKEQFDPFSGRLIDSWLTYPQIKQIDLTVNWQLWTLLDYLGRYRFINQLGTAVREHGYNLRVFNQQQQCLALYKYNDTTNPPKWEIQIEGVGDSLQVQPVEGEL